MYDIVVLQSLWFRPSTRKRKVHSGDRFLGTCVFGPRKGPFRVDGRLKIAWYVWTGPWIPAINCDALRICCKWIHPLWAKHLLCVTITWPSRMFVLCFVVHCTTATWNVLRRTLNAGNELLLLAPDAVLRIQILLFLIWKTLHKRHKNLKERKFVSFIAFLTRRCKWTRILGNLFRSPRSSDLCPNFL